MMCKSTAIVVVALLANISSGYCEKRECPTIVSKESWGGQPATEITYQVRPIEYVIIHHTVTDKCSTLLKCSESLQNIQNYHMNELEFDDIGLNFLIGNDGRVYEGTGWGVRGSHTYGYNMNGTGIAFIGNFQDKLPTRSALNAAKDLLSCGVEAGELSRRYRLLSARQVSSTKSPGLALYNEIRTWSHWKNRP